MPSPITVCPSCSSAIPPASNFCPACGSAVEQKSSDLTVTVETLKVVVERPSDASRTPSSDGRFPPGAMLGDRYRIVGLLGRGGMGEVYRADDLKLGQPVALKFLPGEVCTEAMLTRFYNEVRIARQVSHPNVCRVHDIFDVPIGDGKVQHFLSMEYIDGEDLASLLRRIGRLPKDKALEISRQLCAGLAAAHVKGVLHRDLKPANIMLDGRGQVSITDFGLAGLAKEFIGADIRAGTPAYMSPEQIAGKEVTIRSDIYSLGLVLYEVFTGRRAFSADSAAEFKRLHESGTPTQPSQFIDEFDPVVERVILRCLNKDPAQRPPSVAAVAAALPGGDPLAAALAAGETPSPEMVAAAGGDSVALHPAVGAACVAIILLGVVLIGWLANKTHLIRYVPIEKPAVVLADRARTILADLGYTDPPADRAYWITRDQSFLNYLQRNDASRDRWERLRDGRPPVVVFLYRESPTRMNPINVLGQVWYYDPPQTQRGMAGLQTDMSGRLTYLRIVTDDWPKAASAAPVDWSGLFAAAGLDMAAFKSVEPDFTPGVYCDALAQWTGVYPNQPDVGLRVHASALGGKPVYFELSVISAPAIANEDQSRAATSPGAAVKRPPARWNADWTANLRFALQILILTGSMWLAHRNLRLGRGDRRGAFRLAVLMISLSLVSWLMTTHHADTPAREWMHVNQAMGVSLWLGFFAWICYMAVEPYVRRRCPETMITWTRLLAGRFTDPRVGRDLLIGGLFAVVTTLFSQCHYLTSSWLDGLPPVPYALDFTALQGLGWFVHACFMQRVPEAIVLPMICVLIVLVLRVVLRRHWAAVAVFFLLLAALSPSPFDSNSVAVNTAFRAVYAVIYIAVLFQFGVLALIFGMLFGNFLLYYPVSFDFSAWHAWMPVTVVGLVVASCVYGFYLSLAGRPLFREAFIED